jgi:hypothetical protein
LALVPCLVVVFSPWGLVLVARRAFSNLVSISLFPRAPQFPHDDW